MEKNDYYKDYLVLCDKCRYNFNILTGNDGLYENHIKGKCKCCGKEDDLIVLDVFGDKAKEYLRQLKEL